MLKKQQRQWMHEISIEGESNNERTRLIDTLPDATNIPEKVENLFLSEVLRNAINMLPERQRLVVIKSTVLNCRQVDIAVELGIAPQAVFNLRSRGLARLRKILKKCM